MASSEIEELLKNNEPPSESILQELDEFLSIPLKDLETLDREILNLERQIHNLKNKRKQVQKRVTRYSTILSPIRRIPSDILHEIFYHCLSSGRNPIMSATDCPVLLTHVCSTWRRLALSSPRLWARLHVPILDVDDLPDDAEGEAAHALYQQRQMQIRVLKLRCAIVKEWLSRSGMCPLSISIHCSTYDTTVSSENAASELLRTLAAYSNRWQRLEMTVPFGVFLKLDRILVAEELTVLTSFAVSFQTLGSYGRMTSHSSSSILKAPHLKSVSMVDKHGDLWRLPKIIESWSKITYFCCRVPVTPRNMAILCRNLPNVVYLQVHISTNYNRSAVGDGVGSDQESISLPLLRTLILSDRADNMHYRHLRNFYRCIEAPGLTQLTYSSLTGHQSRDPDFLPVLQRSTSLEKLAIDTTNFSVDDIRTILRSVPGLLHLEVNATLQQAALLNATSRGQPGVLGVLMAGGGDPMEDGADITCLLPRLETLRIHSPSQINETSDEILQNFILSRIDPRRGAAPATLKHVSIRFQRPKQKEIADILHRHAERIGVDFKLELKYLPQGVEEVDDREQKEMRLALSPGSGVEVRVGI